MSKRRLSKEELEHDALIENYNKAVQYIDENKTTILSIAIAVVVVIGSLVGYHYYSSAQEEQAQQLLATAENYYNQGDFEKALNGDSFELTYGFAQISDEFSGTDAGNIATYYAAVCSYKLGNIPNAITYIEKYDVPEGILGVGPLSFHGNLLELNGNYEKAAEIYVRAANWNENSSTTPYNLLKAAKEYYKAGNYQKAEELTTRVIEEYPESSEFAESKKLKGKLAVRS